MGQAEGISMRAQVANARPDDAGKGVARVSRSIMQRLSLVPGQAVEIIGERRTSAIALPLHPDEGLDIIHLDGLQRANAGIADGCFAEVRAANARPARRIAFAPVQANRPPVESGEALRRGYFQRPLTAGDILAVPSGLPAAEPEACLAVVSTEPRGVVIVGDATEIDLLSECTARGVILRRPTAIAGWRRW